MVTNVTSCFLLEVCFTFELEDGEESRREDRFWDISSETTESDFEKETVTDSGRVGRISEDNSTTENDVFIIDNSLEFPLSDFDPITEEVLFEKSSVGDNEDSIKVTVWILFDTGKAGDVLSDAVTESAYSEVAFSKCFDVEWSKSWLGYDLDGS